MTEPAVSAAAAVTVVGLASTSQARQAQTLSLLDRLRHALPEGRGLPQNEWRIRHRAVVVFILAHAVGLMVFGLVRGWPAGYAIGEGVLLAGLGGIAVLPQFTRKMRASVAALGCVASSAVLVQFSGGVIEAHFHFFVVVALISLYQDWAPFLVAVGFVALDHGVLGTLLPEWVYNHQAALDHPWMWAGIHAVLVLAECVALIVVWRANEQARAETERVLRSTAEGLLGVDDEFRVTFANPAAVSMVGGSEAAVLGKPLALMLLGDDGRPMFAGPDVLRRQEGAFTLQAFLARADGGRLPIEVLCTPVQAHGFTDGAVVAIRDLTERLRAENERHAAALQTKELDQLRQVNEFKNRFMNMAAHELNTPLTPIGVQLATLKRRADAPPLVEHKSSIHLLDRNFQRLTALVQDLLDSTRLQSDRLPIHPQAMDLAAMAQECADSFRPAYEANHVQLAVAVPEALPCIGDPSRLSQAISNLLGNALKFTPEGGQVDLEVRVRGDRARVEVRDTGAGLDGEQRARLFQPFEQVHDAQVIRKGGSGLGLYITRGIVENHGGRIWCESDGAGHGSLFAFELPLSGRGSKPPAAAQAVAA